MLASFTSILPSGIGFGSTKDDAKDRSMKDVDPVTPTAKATAPPDDAKREEAKSSDAGTQEVNVKKKKERGSNEVRFNLCQNFLVVLIFPSFHLGDRPS